MDNNIYVMLSRQTALFRDMDITANNLANVNTTGFGSEHLLFQSYLVDGGNKNKVAFTHDISSYRNTEDGSFQVTHNPLDLAIRGNGYFVIETPLGNRYTRAGNFQIDAEGILVTAEGYPVLDNGGQRITFSEEDRAVVVGGIGNIVVDGGERAQLDIVQFANDQLLEPVGDKLFKTDAAPLRPEEDSDMSVAQGMLENSNVEPVREMVHMIDVSRSVGTTAKYVEMIYDLQRRTARAYTQQA